MPNILITGASSGIGRALALHLLSEGHAVWGIARCNDKLEQLLAEAKSNKFFYSVCDVAKEEDMAGLKAEMESKGFKPDTLMLNAGVTSNDAQLNHNTNFKGVENCWNAFKADLQRSGGIVAVSGSLFALVPAPFNPSYSQSKLDALNFLKHISASPENHGIKFNYFVLGPIQTQPGIALSFPKSLVIPSAGKTAAYITKHLGSTGLINIFPLSSKVMILLSSMLPKAVMNWLMALLKR